MTELSFLISLLLNEKLPLELKQLVAERIKEVESRLQQPAVFVPRGTSVLDPIPRIGAQAPSTQRILDEMAAGIEATMPAVIAQTPAAQAALNARAQAIAQATSGREEKGRTSPRKF